MQSDDTDQLDWVLSQKEQPVIDATLNQLKDTKHISSFFAYIVAKFQQEKPVSEQLIVLKWLKTMLKLHWVTVVKLNSSSHDL